MRRSLKKTLATTVEVTLRGAYERLPEKARAAVPEAVKGFVRNRIAAKTLVSKYDSKLWGGFSPQALADLARIKADPSLSAHDRAEACYSLARWCAAQGDFAAALGEIEDWREIDPRGVRAKRQYMLEALFLCRLGRPEETRALVERRSAGRPFDVSVQLMKANTWNPAITGVCTPEAEEKMLEYINSVYRHFNLPEIAKRDAGAPLSIDNLRGRDVEARHDPHNKVTVIVPAYNAADTIATALTSIAEQSWRNIEVLVVDDCSMDDTAGVVDAFCKTDERFCLIRQPANGGSYACRNRALEEASGKFITVHDADDWAHPSRIEQQILALLKSDKPYNLSRIARATPQLAFFGAWRPSGNLLSLNLSSLLIARSALDRVGCWSDVRISADHEFVKRLDLLLGGTHKSSTVSACPLAFGRSVATSLTRHESTHVKTIHHGVRRTYQEVADVWHASLKTAASRGVAPVAPPNLPFPPTIRSVRAVGKKLDVVFIGDFNMSGGTYHYAINMLRAARAARLNVGVFQYFRYDLDVSQPLKAEVITYAAENDVRIVCAGECIDVDTVVVTHPPLLHYRLDMFPRMNHRRLIVVVNQMAERDKARQHIAYDPAVAREHLVAYFGHEGEWTPISGLVRAFMEADPRYPRPQKDTWTPMLDIQEWCARTPRWRGRERSRPVIGRHGRDHPLKWPGDRRALLSAYCADQDCEVRFLGGAAHARKTATRWPANWVSYPFGSRDVKDFLAGLDVFVHYPHDDYIEEFGRAPMEAMAIGVPVILPLVFRGTFGDAALYAGPDEVWPTIEGLWKTEEEWMRRVEAGRSFVRRYCSYENFPARLGLSETFLEET